MPWTTVSRIVQAHPAAAVDAASPMSVVMSEKSARRSVLQPDFFEIANGTVYHAMPTPGQIKRRWLRMRDDPVYMLPFRKTSHICLIDFFLCPPFRARIPFVTVMTGGSSAEHDRSAINTREASVPGARALIDVDLRLAIGEDSYSVEELDELLAGESDGLVFFRGRWIEVDREKLQQAIEQWQRIQKQAQKGERTFAQGMRLLARIPDIHADMEGDEVFRQWSVPQPRRGFENLPAAVRQDGQAETSVDGLDATLRPYQAHGVKRLSFPGRPGLGGL